MKILQCSKIYGYLNIGIFINCTSYFEENSGRIGSILLLRTGAALALMKILQEQPIFRPSDVYDGLIFKMCRDAAVH